MRSFTIAAAATTLASFANSLAVRDNSTTSANTVDLFLDDAINGQGLYAASIVSVCKDHTVYAIQCTSARDDLVGSQTCGPNAQALTVTQAPTVFQVTFVTESTVAGYEGEVSLAESCELRGTTEADCQATVTMTVEGLTSIDSSTSTLLTGTDVNYYPVTITGGAEKTRAASATDACKPEGNAAAGIGANSVRAAAAALAVGLMGLLVL